VGIGKVRCGAESPWRPRQHTTFRGSHRFSMAAIIMSLSMLVATAAADCLSFSRNPHASFAAVSDCRTIAIYEYTPFCNGPGDVKSPRVIVTPPSSRFCPWLAPRPRQFGDLPVGLRKILLNMVDALEGSLRIFEKHRIFLLSCSVNRPSKRVI